MVQIKGVGVREHNRAAERRRALATLGLTQGDVLSILVALQCRGNEYIGRAQNVPTDALSYRVCWSLDQRAFDRVHAVLERPQDTPISYPEWPESLRWEP